MKYPWRLMGNTALAHARNSLRLGYNEKVLGHSNGRVSKSRMLPALLAAFCQPAGFVQKWR